MTSATVADPAPTRWLAVAMALGAGVIAALQVGKVPPALPALRQELGLDLVTAGWVASMLSAVAALLGAVVGARADVRRPRRAIVDGLALLAAGGLVGAVADSGWLLLVGRFVEGIGLLACVVAAPRMIMLASRAEDRGLAMGIWGAYMPAGMALAMLAAAWLLPAVGWRGVWWVNLALVAGFLPAFWLATRDADGAAAGRGVDWPAFAATLRRAGPWLLAFGFGVYTIQWFAMMAWLPTLLIETLALGATSAAVLAALVVGSNAIGNLASAALLHRGAPRWLLIAAAFLAMAACAVGFYAEGLGAVPKVALAFAFSTLSGLLPAAIFASMPRHAPAPHQVGVINGMAVQSSNLGNLLGPPAMAAIVAGFGGWSQGYWLMLLAGAAGLATALALAAVERRPQSSVG